MNGNHEAWRVLEYPRLREILASFALSDPGRQLIAALTPELPPQEVARSLSEISEARTLLEQHRSIPVNGSEELQPLLTRLQTPGAQLDARELLAVRRSLAAAKACHKQLADQAQAPGLAQLAQQLERLPALAAELAEALNDQGEILDNASFELADIRAELRKARERVRSLLEGLLGDSRLSEVFQERLITERNGRAVLPVKADFRGRLKGFIHDESGSGQTLYVEPAAALEVNNRVAALQRAELREIEKILLRLSGRVADTTPELRQNQALLARLDLLAAAGEFALRTDAHAPQLLEEPEVRLRQARHPLLLLTAQGAARGLEVVPVDLRLTRDNDTLVISGPNTGGKTVALKTFGLLALMVRSGLPIPCHPDSAIYPFTQVFADIGDEQSIEASLSTFSGHIERLVRVLSEVQTGALVLLDELGTGTDPAEGGALALSVLDRLRDAGASTVVTTHLNLVKGYAQQRGGVENAAVEFDPETLAPSYRLHYGVPGASSAFTIARRLGLPEEVLERAGEYLGSGEREGLELVEDLNRMRQELEQERSVARAEREAARRERSHRKQLLEEVDREKGFILDKARKRAANVVRKAEQQVHALLETAQQQPADKPHSARLKAELKQIRKDVGEQRTVPPKKGETPDEVLAGELLWVVPLAIDAVVVKDCGREIELDLHGKRTRVKRVNLEQYQPRRFRDLNRQVTARSTIERDAVPTRLVLVGVRVEEALQRLERFLDDALLAGHAQLEVVHGSGSGKLRKAVREMLRGQRTVASFYAAPSEQGGENVTIVDLGE